MTQYRINKIYELSLIVEASTADAAFELSKGIDLDIKVNNSSPKIRAVSCKYTGDSTTYKAAVTQAQVAIKAKALEAEVARRKSVMADRRARDAEIQALLAGRNA